MAEKHQVVRETFDEAGEVLGLDMWHLVSEGPQERLNQTEITQPVLLTASTALWRAWQLRNGGQPAILAGHSLGEYSALVCAGALTFAEGVALVHKRGKLMQEAVPEGEGAMAAILGLDDDVVGDCCEQVDGVVSPANYNAPSQVVIAGSADAVAAAVEACNEAGARKTVALQVSGPFHCELMAPAKVGFAEALDGVELKMPEIPVVHNVDASIAVDLTDLREKLLEQIARPVQWTRCMQAMIDAGADQFVECGAGKVLAGLIKRIDRKMPVHNIESPEAFEAAL
jgi:[acyl-carrier-protein] S-malonyltransferase